MGLHCPFVFGDVDTFLGLFNQTLAALALLLASLEDHSGDGILFKRVVPGVGLSLFLGNSLFALQAWIRARQNGSSEYCAQPFGINTPGAFAFAFSILLPSYQNFKGDNQAKAEHAWQIATTANLWTSVVIFIGTFLMHSIQKLTPKLALLSSLAGISFSFLALSPMCDIAAKPIIGFICLFLIIVDLFDNMEEVSSHLGTIIPIAILAFLGTLQCCEGARCAGDDYNVMISNLIVAFANICGALFGSYLPLTVYVGHSGFKHMGGRVGYSILHGSVVFILSLTGLIELVVSLISVQSVAPLVAYVGIHITVDVLSFVQKEPRYFPAFLLAFAPPVCDWASSTIGKNVAHAYIDYANTKLHPPIDLPPIEELAKDIAGIDYVGLSQFGNGSMLTAILLCALTMNLIDRKFHIASFWCILSATLSFVGLIHMDTIKISLDEHECGWRFAAVYLLIGLVCVLLYYGQRSGMVDGPYCNAEVEGENSLHSNSLLQTPVMDNVDDSQYTFLRPSLKEASHQLWTPISSSFQSQPSFITPFTPLHKTGIPFSAPETSRDV